MSPKKLSRIKSNTLERSVAVSVAGLRAGGAVALNHAGSWWMRGDKRDAHRQAVLEREAGRFADELGKLKGSYVKIGQMLALFGEHILPPELTRALHTLEHQTAALSWSAIEPILVAELGDKLAELEVDQEPLAAASLGQVHRATVIATGEAICLKIQYPGVQRTIDADFNAVIRMLKLARWVSPGADLDEWLAEIREQLHEEVDYVREADTTEAMRQRLRQDKRFIIPEVKTAYSTSRVLALEYVEGVEVSDKRVARLSLQRRNYIARAMLELFFAEVFEWGIMQSDPNFGNYRIQIDPDGDKLVLLDFGAVRTFCPEFIAALRRTIAATFDDDESRIVQGILDLNCLPQDSHPEARQTYAGFCRMLLEPMRDSYGEEVPAAALNRRGEYRWGQARLIKRAGKYAAKSAMSRHFVTPPKEFAFLARKLTGVFTFLAVLDAQFNGNDILARYITLWRDKEA